MKKSLLSICLFLTLSSYAQVTIPDANFRAKLKIQYPGCFTGDILDTVCAENDPHTELRIENSSISTLEGIRHFKKIDFLDCSYNQLSFLPELPSSLMYMYCNNNNITTITSFPDYLLLFFCNNNKITSLPAFPNSLYNFSCDSNQLTSLPILPNSLAIINCGRNQLTSLPTLPGSLLDFNCGYNKLTTIPALPNSLTYFNCDSNQLNTLPILPVNLQTLICSSNSLASLSSLPNNLKTIFCNHNQLTSLPSLPGSLIRLDCFHNQLTSLPTLPNTLAFLAANNNQLTSLPTLPETLDYLAANNNQLTSLPKLPTSLSYILCQNNPLSCLPFLPAELFLLNFNNTSISCLPNKPSGIASIYSYFPICSPAYNKLLSSLNITDFPNTHECQAFPVLSGNIYIDLNNNNTFDMGEFYIPNFKINIPEKKLSSLTNSNGFYELITDTIGSITVEATTPKYYTSTLQTVIFSYYGERINQDFALQPINTTTQDISTLLTPLNQPRPGFNISFKIDYANVGTMTTATDLVFDYPSNFTIDSSSLGAVSNTNQLSWSLGNLLPGESGSLFVYGKILASTTLGDSLTFESSANKSTPNDDAYFEDNISIKKLQVVGSYDPNDKTATPLLTPPPVLVEDYIYYTIRFQNTGTDTAFTVVVADTLENKIDASTLEVTSTSHSCNTSINDNKVYFEFPEIKLEDQTHNEPASHGYVSFRVKPKNTVQLNDVIENHAAIFFDYNSPIITNTAQTHFNYTLSTKEAKEASNRLYFYPNPASSQIRFLENGLAELYSSEGFLLLNKQVQDQTLDISTLRKGLYYIKFTTPNGKKSYGKIIKE